MKLSFVLIFTTVLFISSSRSIRQSPKCNCNTVAPLRLDQYTNDVLKVARIAHTVLPNGTPALPHALLLVTAVMYFAPSYNVTAGSAGYAMLNWLTTSNETNNNAIASQMASINVKLPSNADAIAMSVSSRYPGAIEMTMYEPSNPASTKPNIAQCDTIEDPDGWQPLCVPSGASDGVCMPQINSGAMLANAPLVGLNGSVYRPIFFEGLPVPTNSIPLSRLFKSPNTNQTYANEYKRLVEIMYPLTDYKKVVAEAFVPPAFLSFLTLAIDDLALHHTGSRNCARILFTTMGAMRDAVITISTLKASLSKMRPITVLQCGLFGTTQDMMWKGPYQGMGRNISLSFTTRYMPYVDSPNSPSFPSGHTAVSKAGAVAYTMATGRSKPKTTNCLERQPGTSMGEGRIQKGEAGYIQGVTDVPNKGPFSMGFVPAGKVSVCWTTWNDYARLTAVSRLYGGIHTPIENNVAKVIGSRAGKQMIKYMEELRKM